MAILTDQVKYIFNSGEIWGSALCKAVTQSSHQRFPTPANAGRIRGSAQANNCLYNHTEKLPTADKESPSGPKHYYKHCYKAAQVITVTMDDHD